MKSVIKFESRCSSVSNYLVSSLLYQPLTEGTSMPRVEHCPDRIPSFHRANIRAER